MTLFWFAALVLAAFGCYFLFGIDSAVIAMEFRRIENFELLAVLALLMLSGQPVGSPFARGRDLVRRREAAGGPGWRALSALGRTADVFFLLPLRTCTKDFPERPAGRARQGHGAPRGGDSPVASMQSVAGRLFAPSLYLLLAALMLEVVAPAQTPGFQALLLAGLLPALILLATSWLLSLAARTPSASLPGAVDRRGSELVLLRLLPLLLVVGLYAGFWPPFAAAGAIALSLGLNRLLAGQQRWPQGSAAMARALMPFGSVGVLFGLGVVWSSVVASLGLSEVWVGTRIVSGTAETLLALAVAAAWLSAAALLRPLPALIVCAPILFPMGLRGGLAPEQLVVLTVLALSVGHTWPSIRAGLRPSRVEALSLTALVGVALWPALTVWLPGLL